MQQIQMILASYIINDVACMTCKVHEEAKRSQITEIGIHQIGL